jgi:hypothetical protein
VLGKMRGGPLDAFLSKNSVRKYFKKRIFQSIYISRGENLPTRADSVRQSPSRGAHDHATTSCTLKRHIAKRLIPS